MGNRTLPSLPALIVALILLFFGLGWSSAADADVQSDPSAPNPLNFGSPFAPIADPVSAPIIPEVSSAEVESQLAALAAAAQQKQQQLEATWSTPEAAAERAASRTRYSGADPGPR